VRVGGRHNDVLHQLVKPVIAVGLVGAFYLKGVGNRSQASPSAVSVPLSYYYEIQTGPECGEYGWNCDNGGGCWFLECVGEVFEGVCWL